MTGSPRPLLKSLPPAADRPGLAELAAAPVERGAPKGVARQGVHSALRPDPQPNNRRYPVAWLHITVPGRGAIPTATSICECGRNRSAVGQRKVLALIEEHTAHRDDCPLRAVKEDRTAA